MYAGRLQSLVPHAKKILTCYELPKWERRNAGLTDAKSTPQGTTIQRTAITYFMLATSVN